MANKRKRHSPEFKAKVALEALKGLKTSQELAREYEVHPTQIAQWKRQLREHAGDVFHSNGPRSETDRETELTQAYEQIGRLNLALAWLKKLHRPNRARRCLIEPDRLELSSARQCALLGLARRTYYYHPVAVSPEQRALMTAIDQLYLLRPFYGSRQMTAELRRQGWRVNRKRIQRLMRLMGLAAVAPGPHTSRAQPQNPIYPYLLRRYPPQAPNDAWAADITWVPMPIGSCTWWR